MPHTLHSFETVLALLVGVAFFAMVARRLAVPTPALLVTGGLLVAFGDGGRVGPRFVAAGIAWRRATPEP